jgi:hypothetical protein
MWLSVRDRLATLLVAAIAVPYLGYLIFGMMPFVLDARSMAATGMVLGLAAGVIGAWPEAGLDRPFWLLGVLGAGTMAAGVAALVTGSGGLLALFMGGIGLQWALTSLRHHWIVTRPPAPQAPPAQHLVSRW